jgi:transposase
MGILGDVFEQLVAQAEPREAHIDSTSSKVHKHANTQTESPENQCVGKSKGGRNTKIHGAVDEQDRPLKVFLSPGNDHDSKHALELIRGIQSAVIAADKAYDTNAIREDIERSGNTACIPPKANRTEDLPYDEETYKRRHKIENFFQRIKEHRAIATRYEKLSTTFLGLVTLSAIIDWIR